MKTLDCAVAGAGIMGVSAALSLARLGHRVRLFDQYPFEHDRGSSHGPTRLFRLAYFEHPDYVPLLRRSLEGWRALERETGEALYKQTGLVEIGPPDGFLVGGARRAAAMHDLPLEEISERTFSDRFGWMRLAAGDTAIIEPAAGFILADKAIRCQLEAAKRLGAALHPQEKIVSWRRGEGGRLVIRTEQDDYRADRLVVATGAWARELLGETGALVEPVEKVLFWVGAGEARFHADNGFMPFAVETRDQSMFYGFPAIDADGVKAGEHTGGTPLAEPETQRGAAIEAARQRFSEFLREYAPGLPTQITQEKTCLYQQSPDGNFLIGAHPEDDGVVFATGHAGHGFKFAPVIGEALAMLASGNALAPEFRLFDPARFAKDQARTSV